MKLLIKLARFILKKYDSTPIELKDKVIFNGEVFEIQSYTMSKDFFKTTLTIELCDCLSLLNLKTEPKSGRGYRAKLSLYDDAAPHWIIEDKGFGGMSVKCSECGEIWYNLFDDTPCVDDPCPVCGAQMDEDATEYI